VRRKNPYSNMLATKKTTTESAIQITCFSKNELSAA
jgi:hypothetical protein